MKRFIYLTFLTLVLASCGTDGHHFKIDGRLLNLNQGEFFVYSNDGVIDGIDTIQVRGGRFSYEVRCESEGTLIIMFPNYSEQPVFATPGKSVELRGDASRLKELTVKGTAENKLMNKFRESIVSVSPPESRRLAAQFIEDHPESRVAVYLLDKYLVQCQEPDFKLASKAATSILKAQPDNERVRMLGERIRPCMVSGVGSKLPQFSAKDIYGKVIDSKSLQKGDAIIYAWAPWDYESSSLQRSLSSMKKYNEVDVQLVGICIDGNAKECRTSIEREKMEVTAICEDGLLEGKLMKQLGLITLPDNIILKDGKVVARNLTASEIRKRFKI